MNVYDSELVAGILEKENYQRAETIETADMVFLNTCSVREHAEDKVNARLDALNALKRKHKGAIIGVLGCMAQNLKDSLLETKPYVDIILGPDSYRRLPELINQRAQKMNHLVDTKLSKMELYEGLFPANREGINAWISITRGCDKFCTFCIVPFTRGRERSRTIENIMTEAELVVNEGFKEITLLGQNVNSFHSEGNNFSDLLRAVSKIDGLQRVRYTSPHPQDFDDELIDLHAENPKICNHIHFPLQAGSDRVLTRMNRTYTKAHYIDLALKMRERIRGVSITTDMIVGFPGETDADFDETLAVMEAVKFDAAFTFKYSARPGTKAAEYADSVPEEIKQKRLEKMIEVQRTHTLYRNKLHIGEVMSVLVEKDSKKSKHQYQGRTTSNKIVVFNKGLEKIGDKVLVEIEEASGITLFGKIVN